MDYLRFHEEWHLASRTMNRRYWIDEWRPPRNKHRGLTTQGFSRRGGRPCPRLLGAGFPTRSIPCERPALRGAPGQVPIRGRSVIDYGRGNTSRPSARPHSMTSMRDPAGTALPTSPGSARGCPLFGGHVGVARQLWERAEVIADLQRVRRGGVPERGCRGEEASNADRAQAPPRSMLPLRPSTGIEKGLCQADPRQCPRPGRYIEHLRNVHRVSVDDLGADRPCGGVLHALRKIG
jgi:hypothetical protein